MIGSLAPARRGSVPLTVLAVPVLAVPVFVGSVAVPAPASALDAADDLGAVRLLHLAMAAPETVSYTGTQYVATWSSLDGAESTSAVVDVIHRAGGVTQVRAHGAWTLSAVDERSSARWLADSGGPVGLLVRTHDVAIVGVGSVAGRPAHVVEARRADGTAAARLWLDTESALPLRREVYNDDGSTRAASAFIEFSIERASGPARTASLLAADTALHRDDLARLRDDGWSCPDRLGDGLVLYEARQVGDAVQLSYSDGVVTISVFEQRGHLDEDELAGFAAREVEGGVVYSSAGPPAQLTWSVGDWVVTVVADAPAETIDTVIAAMPPREPEYEHGFLARIGKGAERLASWLNPFS